MCTAPSSDRVVHRTNAGQAAWEH